MECLEGFSPRLCCNSVRPLAGVIKVACWTALLSLSHKAVLFDQRCLYVCPERVGPIWMTVSLFFFVVVVVFPLQSFSLKMHLWPLSTITICQVPKAGFSMWLGNLSGLSTTLPDKYRTKIVMQESSKYAVLCYVCWRRVLSVWRTQTRACCSVQLQLVKLPISSLPAMRKCLVRCQTRHIGLLLLCKPQDVIFKPVFGILLIAFVRFSQFLQHIILYQQARHLRLSNLQHCRGNIVSRFYVIHYIARIVIYFK